MSFPIPKVSCLADSSRDQQDKNPPRDLLSEHIKSQLQHHPPTRPRAAHSLAPATREDLPETQSCASA